MSEIVSKTDFAKVLGVTAGRVSQLIAEKKIHGDAIVGRGVRARIRVSTAREQLSRSLDIDQHLGMNGKAKLDALTANAVEPLGAADADDTVEDRIKAARLEQLAISNAKAREEAAARSGRYLLAEDARQELGRVAGRMLALFDSGLTEFANALAGKPAASSREVLRVLRSTWRDIRVRSAKVAGAEAAELPALVEDGGESDRAA